MRQPVPDADHLIEAVEQASATAIIAGEQCARLHVEPEQVSPEGGRVGIAEVNHPVAFHRMLQDLTERRRNLVGQRVHQHLGYIRQ